MSSEVSGALVWAHPVVRDWFVRRFGTPTEPQEQGWPHILAGTTTLICSPTGSGKTLAAFLACIDRLVRKALAGDLQDRTEVLYVSPLKALGNDIQKNLETPLSEILQLAGERGLLMPEIRTAVRTGDTLMQERRAMLRRPPHILVTTPESFYILLTAERSRALLKDVETVIVDEIHAVADDKRGAHLALSLERLEALRAGSMVSTHDAAEDGRATQARAPVRIGLSATQKPIELVAEFLIGSGRPKPAIVQIGQRRELDLAVEVPKSPLGPVASNEMWDEIYDRIGELVAQHRSTLVFVNTRRLAERVAHNLVERLGEDAVAAHHGSLARKLRLVAEKKLKAGELKVVVATASLELGIDVGTVDLVCQIGSPRAIAVGLQRVGRAGHWRGAVPKGRFFVTTRDELVECAALVRAIRQGELDKLEVPPAPLDVLAQQIVAACAAEEWGENELLALTRRAYPYRDLPREDFEAVVAMLSEGIAARRGRYGAYLHRDRVNGRLKARRGARLAAITSGGAIPDNALYTVVAEPEGTVVGTVDEDFAVESMKGDIMLLGNTSWQIRRVESSGRMLVEDAHGAPPTIPFWRGEAPARTPELSAQVAELRETVSKLAVAADVGSATQTRATPAVAWLKSDCGLDDAGAEQMVEYIVLGRASLGAVPTQTTVIAERFFDEGGGMQLVLHAPFGGRINKAWGLALRKRFCRSFNFELQAAATDDGLNISLTEQHSFPLADVFHFLQAETLQEVLEQAALQSPLFGTRWRWDASRALALLRFSGGKKVPPQIQRMRSDDLLAAVFPDAAACQDNIEGDIALPNHPLVREVMKDILNEALDLEGLKCVLRDIAAGRIRSVAVDTVAPSAFAHEILNANPYAYLDDAPLEERRARAVEMRRMLPESVLEEVGRLDPAAIAEVTEDAWPEVRDADELHDALLTLVALPENGELRSPARAGAPVPTQSVPTRSAWPDWQAHFEQLATANRAARVDANGKGYWVAAERKRSFCAIFPAARFEAELPDVEPVAPSRDDALLAMITGWMMHSGPTTANELGKTLGLPGAEIDKALLRLEAAGTILRGSFRGAVAGEAHETEWCERRLLARIHRLTLGTLRKQIEPVTAVEFMRWLLRWQHVAPGTQLRGERGVLEALRQLQGFEVPANAWEPQVLARRVAEYDPHVLDQLCLTGAVGWGRLSPHPATLEDSTDSRRRVVPTSVAPITFFVREEADWMLPQRPVHGAGDADHLRGLSHGARGVFDFLRQRGASFFADIVRGTEKLKAEVETALWELVAGGLVTADGFDNLRALIDPKRRSGHGSGRATRPRHSTGRWSLLYAGDGMGSDRSRAVAATCRMLLARYGVVFRDLLAREAIVPAWRELLIAFRRLEDRGEVRGGRFVSGFLGEQFALPMAVESLRAQRRSEPSGERLTLSAADPLNLVGILVPGERVPAISGKTVTLRDGVLLGEESGDARARAGD
ncbi:MAG: DEAD/DEAH box helicase [Acidobacteria bacterium]|nr:DEAD/DEAH box helicase [Acidobacteriota bacterium]